MSLQYPKLTHDEKRSTKLTLKEVQKIQKDFPKNPNYKIFAERYAVAQSTIRWWVDEEYKQKTLIFQIKCRKERMKNDLEFRKHKQKLLNQSLTLKRKTFPKMQKYHEQYYLKNCDKLKEIRKNYSLKNKDKISKNSKKYYQKNKIKIKQQQKKYRQNFQEIGKK